MQRANRTQAPMTHRTRVPKTRSHASHTSRTQAVPKEAIDSEDPRTS